MEEETSVKKRSKRFILAAGALWLLAVGGGTAMLWKYASTSGVSGNVPSQWPQESSIRPSKGLAALVMLAHPKCPCTRASIGELAWIMTHAQNKTRAYVLFLKPVGFPDDWEKTDLWQSASAIPGVTALADSNGLEAKRFNVQTSGHTILYDAEGKLVFSGGITAARGHSGDNAGRDAIVSFLNDGKKPQSQAPVFGCSIVNPKGTLIEKDKS